MPAGQTEEDLIERGAAKCRLADGDAPTLEHAQHVCESCAAGLDGEREACAPLVELGLEPGAREGGSCWGTVRGVREGDVDP